MKEATSRSHNFPHITKTTGGRYLMLPYPKFVRFVKQVFSLNLRQTRLANLQLTVGLRPAARAKLLPLPHRPLLSVA